MKSKACILNAMKWSRVSFLAILVLALLVGCSGLSKKPEISLAGIDLVGLGLLEQRFVLKLRILNPNDADLSVNALRFDVEIEGRHFARGVSESALVVPPLGESVLEIATVSRLGDILKPLLDVQKTGRDQVDYRVYGSAEVCGLGRLPFERFGAVPFSVLEKKFRLK